MKIHLAAWWQNGCGDDMNMHSRNLHAVRYPYLLESFHYMTRRTVDLSRATGIKFFLDSGAYSMFTQGVKIDLERYAKFILQYRDCISVASNLDDITKTESISYANQKRLEELGCAVQPVFHAREDPRWLVKYLDEGYDYIFIGGLVPETTKWLEGWLDHIWHHYLTNPDGTARVKVHGFGLTSLPLMFRYPWESVDSTSWLMTSNFGAIFLDFDRGNGVVQDYKIDFSNKSGKRYDMDSWHFNSLNDTDRRTVLQRLEELEAARPKNPELEEQVAAEMGCRQGFYPEALAVSYGWRRYANAEYFRRAMNRRIDRFTHRQPELWDF